MGVGAEFNTSTYKNGVVDISINLFCIFICYSKGIWFDKLVTLSCKKWDGFGVLLKDSNCYLLIHLFVCSSIHSFIHQTSFELSAVPSTEDTKTTQTFFSLPGSHKLLEKEILLD